ncbi:hypothetical protein ONS96_000984 [Cadophora gregata f. sp. sojae]|nr:hypothetical protein ONS96_000984 [Cadophora gregata f. sp. sojae]
MAQSTTSKLMVSLGPPRPSVSLTSTATCVTSTILGVTACIRTPLCLTSPWTVVGTAVTLDSNGLPFLECINTTSGAAEPTTSGPIKPSGIASVSLQHTPLDSTFEASGTSTSNIPSTTSSATGISAPAATQSTNMAGHAGSPSGILIPVFLAWLGIFAVCHPGHI